MTHGPGEITRLKQSKGLLFVNKKKQKNFVNLEFGFAGPLNVWSDAIEPKFFASFFRKRCFFLLLPLKIIMLILFRALLSLPLMSA